MASLEMQEDNSSWDFWDKVYSSKELRQKMEEQTQYEVPMSELLKSTNLCRAEVVVLNTPRMSPSHENTIRQMIKKDLGVDVPLINMEISAKKWTLRFYRREDASQVLRALSGHVYRSRVLHVTLYEVNTEIEIVPSSVNVEEILPQGLPVPDRNSNWGQMEWADMQSFKTDLCDLLRGRPSGMLMEEAMMELSVMRKRGVISYILELFPIGLLRLYAPYVRITGRYLSLSDQDNITALMRLTVAERSPRLCLEEWESMPPSEIRSDQQLMNYFGCLLNHFGPQHITMSLPLRLAVSTITPTYPRNSVGLAKKLVDLSPSFLLLDDLLYLPMSVRHRRLLLESISQPIMKIDRRLARN